MYIHLYSPVMVATTVKQTDRQTDRQKQTVSLNKRQTNYITAYKIPKKC